MITLKEFLGKYTAIPLKFIDEYYKFYELCQTEKYGIPIEKLVKYLGLASQVRLETRLRESYELNYDYVIIRTNQKSMKGIKDAKYMLSFSTFEKICMNSTTKKGAQYRDYYVMLRKFIDYYKEHFANKIMELTQTEKFIYIIAVNKTSKILKLGRTKDIRKRLQNYSTGRDKHPDIKFIMIVKNDKQVESCAKLFAKVYRYKGNRELYKMNNDMLKNIVYRCAELDKSVIDSLESNKSLNTYVVYDDAKTIQYLNLNGEVIGMETKTIKNKPKPKHNKHSMKAV
jgi:phage anti-repressor protein